MPRYRLLRGMHTQGEDPETGQPIVFKAGSVVESDIDLELRFGSEKFQAVDRASTMDNSSLVEELEALRLQNAALQKRLEEAGGDDWYDLQSMSTKELLQYAKENGIDVGGASSKKDIITAIEQVQEAV
jgi:hypothetical protein